MCTQMQRRGRALSSGQTSLPRALIWGFYCLWKLSQANTVPYLFRAVFLEEERCNQQTICYNVWLGKEAFSTSPFDGAPQCKKEWKAHWAANGKRVTTRLKINTAQAFVCMVPQFRSLLQPSALFFKFLDKTIIWPSFPVFINLSTRRASTEYKLLLFPWSIKVFPWEVGTWVQNSSGEE